MAFIGKMSGELARGSASRATAATRLVRRREGWAGMSDSEWVDDVTGAGKGEEETTSVVRNQGGSGGATWARRSWRCAARGRRNLASGGHLPTRGDGELSFQNF